MKLQEKFKSFTTKYYNAFSTFAKAMREITVKSLKAAAKYGKLGGIKDFSHRFLMAACDKSNIVSKAITSAAPVAGIIALAVLVSSFDTVTYAEQISTADFNAPTKYIEAIYQPTTKLANYETVCAVYADGKFLCSAESEEAYEEAKAAVLGEISSSNNTKSAEFITELTTEIIENPVGEIVDDETLENMLAGLDIKATSVKVTEKSIDYNIEYVYDSTLSNDYRKVISYGEEGLSRTTVTTYYVNGNAVDVKTVTETVNEPVTQTVKIGTKKATKSVSISFVWPVKRVERSYVNDTWGAGRNHKGVDICAPCGTPIYAVAAGTVVGINNAGSGYGLNLTLDLGNGIKVMYAHCNSIDVSYGQTVSAGEQIATVGNTGWSTGNHLHFEVIANGTKVDPQPYLGY